MINSFCGACGHPVRASMAFCTECGAAVGGPAATQAPVVPTPLPPRALRDAGVGPQSSAAPSSPQAGVTVLQQRRHRPTARIALLVILLIAGGSTAVAVVLHRSNEGPPVTSPAGSRDPQETDGPRAVADSSGGESLLGQPGGSWQTLAEDLFPGSVLVSLLPGTGPSTYTLEVGRSTIVEAADSDDALVVGLSTIDGSTLWSRPVASQEENCWPVPPSAVLCAPARRAGSYDVVDAANGDVVFSGDAPAPVEDVVVQDDSVLIGTTDLDGRDAPAETITALDIDDYHTLWTTHLPNDDVPGDVALHSEPVLQLTASGGTVRADYDTRYWTVDAADGSLRSHQAVRADRHLVDDAYQVAQALDEGRNQETTVVFDTDGNTLLTADGDQWLDGEDQSGIQAGRIGIGGTLYDLATGQVVWQRDDLPPGGVEDQAVNSFAWADGGRFVTQSYFGTSRSGALLDASTGDTIVTSDTDLEDTNTAFGEDAIVVGEDDGTIASFSTSSGDASWSADLDVIHGDADDTHEWQSLDSTGSAVVAATEIGVGALTDFAVGATTASGSPSDGGTTYATDCGSQPTFTPVESAAANGGVTVTYTVTATCPGGHWLTSAGETVTMTASTSAGEQVFASGVFDFSGSPVFVPDGGGTPAAVVLTFPVETAFATPDEINQAISTNVLHVDCVRDPTAYVAEAPSDPSQTADPAAARQAVAAGQDATASEESALAALRRISAADDPDVTAELEGSWMPQLSSKLPGTQDDGITYTYEDILSEHLRLRLRYPGVRLVNSADWRSFLVPGYWVTLVGSTSPRPGPALRFCFDNRFDVDHCYAKRLLRDGPAEGATKHRD